MIEKLTDPGGPDVDLIKYLSSAMGDAKREHKYDQWERVESRRVKLTAEHWLLLYLTLRDTLSVPNANMLEQPEGFGEMVDPMERFQELTDEYAATGSPEHVAGTLAMLDMREAFARQAVIDVCGEEDYQDDVTTSQMDELGIIAGGIARRVCRAIALDAASAMPSPA